MAKEDGTINPVTGDPYSSPVRLRPVRPDDWSRVHEWARQEIASRYQPWRPNSAEQTERFVADAAATWQTSPHVRAVWAADTPDDATVGMGELRLR